MSQAKHGILAHLHKTLVDLRLLGQELPMLLAKPPLDLRHGRHGIH